MINNAGFCRDKMNFSMSEEEFDSVVRVHLKGHFVNMRHAAAYWREKAKTSGGTVYGRLVSTSSEAFLYGSVGQPNYAAAKAGIVAMTMGAAQALVKYGVTANVIMPRARTDMTMSGGTAAMFEKPAEGFDHFDPAHVAPTLAAETLPYWVWYSLALSETCCNMPRKSFKSSRCQPLSSATRNTRLSRPS